MSALYVGSLVAVLYLSGVSSSSNYNNSGSDFDIWTEGDWDYYNFGPETWGTYYSQYCGSNWTTQSGRIINFTKVENGFDHIEEFILNTVDEYDSNLFHHWDWDNDHTRWEIKNTGHGLSVTAVSNDGTYLNENDNTIAVWKNFFPANEYEHLEYCLYSFHMHWGNDSSVGSEHSINGETYPMEMHFVHFSCNFTDIADAINEFSIYDDPLDLAVVGVVFELSEDGSNNTYLQKILDEVESLTYYEQTKTVTDLNVRDMLDIYSNNSDFWYYEGSLTTPPCDPIVRWHVLEEKLTIGESQLDAFRQLLDLHNRTMHQNWRPPSGTGSGDNQNTIYEFVFNGTGYTTTTAGSDSDGAINNKYSGFVNNIIIITCVVFCSLSIV